MGVGLCFWICMCSCVFLDFGVVLLYVGLIWWWHFHIFWITLIISKSVQEISPEKIFNLFKEINMFGKL